MAVQLTKEFWMNLIIALVTLTALGLSIWALVAPCKSNFGDYSSSSDCIKTGDKCDSTSVCCQSNHCIGGFCRKPPDYKTFINQPVTIDNPFCLKNNCNEFYPWYIKQDIMYPYYYVNIGLILECDPNRPWSPKFSCKPLSINNPPIICTNGINQESTCKFNDKFLTIPLFNKLIKKLNDLKGSVWRAIVPLGVTEMFQTAKSDDSLDLSHLYTNITEWEIFKFPSGP